MALTKTPQATVAHIAGQLRPAVAPDPRQVERLIADLDSQMFAVLLAGVQDFSTLYVRQVPSGRLL